MHLSLILCSHTFIEAGETVILPCFSPRQSKELENVSGLLTYTRFNLLHIY